MTLAMSNGFLVSLLQQASQPVGTVVSYASGVTVPLSPLFPTPVGVSLGASGQIATPGSIAQVRYSTNGPLTAGMVLALPVGVELVAPAAPGTLVPPSMISSGQIIGYALILDDPGPDTVRCLILGASPIPAGGSSQPPAFVANLTFPASLGGDPILEVPGNELFSPFDRRMLHLAAFNPSIEANATVHINVQPTFGSGIRIWSIEVLQGGEEEVILPLPALAPGSAITVQADPIIEAVLTVQGLRWPFPAWSPETLTMFGRYLTAIPFNLNGPPLAGTCFAPWEPPLRTGLDNAWGTPVVYNHDEVDSNPVTHNLLITSTVPGSTNYQATIPLPPGATFLPFMLFPPQGIISFQLLEPLGLPQSVAMIGLLHRIPFSQPTVL